MKNLGTQIFVFAAVLSMSTTAAFASDTQENACHTNARGFRILPKRGVAANSSKPETMVRQGGERGVVAPVHSDAQSRSR